MSAKAKLVKVTRDGYRCTRCQHEWVPRGDAPAVCPACKSPYWHRPRRAR